MLKMDNKANILIRLHHSWLTDHDKDAVIVELGPDDIGIRANWEELPEEVLEYSDKFFEAFNEAFSGKPFLYRSHYGII